MEAKEIEKYKKILLIIGIAINDFGAEFALCLLDKKRTKPDICKIAEDIFGISFKAGIEEAQNRLHSQEVLGIAEEALKKERQAGIKEVVEWINHHTNIRLPQWQAQLKSWGL